MLADIFSDHHGNSPKQRWKNRCVINTVLVYYHAYSRIQVSHTQYTCGFCARNQCSIDLIPADKGTFKIISNCQHSYASIKYKSASEYTPSDPCTNVPILCLLCPPNSKTGRQPVFWRYNMDLHLQDDHPTRDTSLISWKQLVVSKHIPLLETRHILGIKKEKEQDGLERSFREAFEIPNSDDIARNYQVEAEISGAPVRKKMKR